MITLGEVHPWLNQFDKSHLTPSTDYLVDRARTALSGGLVDRARNTCHQLKHLARSLLDEKEVNEAWTECGCLAYDYKDYLEAEETLDESVSRYWSDMHRRAVVKWMLGCVRWKAGRRLDAVVTWRHSIDDFERLSRRPEKVAGQKAWYEETARKLTDSLVDSLGELEDKPEPRQIPEVIPGKLIPRVIITPPPATVEPLALPALPPQEDFSITITPPPAISEPETISGVDIVQLFSILDEIPASPPGPAGVDPFPIGNLEVDTFLINGRRYCIHSLRGTHLINLPFDRKVMAVKIKGDSMDQENILPGDIVLVRQADVPANGDIVMAVVYDEDSCATLKKYYKEKDRIVLQPNSSNPIHKPLIFKNTGEGFGVRGVAIAVLKPA